MPDMGEEESIPLESEARFIALNYQKIALSPSTNNYTEGASRGSTVTLMLRGNSNGPYWL